MHGHCADGRGDRVAQAVQALLQRSGGNRIGALVPPFRHNPLAYQHRYPALLEEQPLGVALDPARAAEKLDLGGKAVRDRHGAHVIPEGGIGTGGGVIVEDEEIAHPVIFIVDPSI